MANIYLNTPQLMALLAQNENHGIALSKLAADAVAEQVLRKIDRGRVVQAVIDSLHKEIIAKYRQNKELDSIINDAMRKAVNGKIELSALDALDEAIAKKVDAIVTRKLAGLLKTL